MPKDPIQTWEVPASTGRHFDVLDGIRGVAILMVVTYHTFYVNPKSGSVSHAIGGLMASGWMGVPVFFVLSGFLISYPFFRQKAKDPRFWNLRGYARRRIGKIIPPFYLSILVFAVYYYARFGDFAYVRAAFGYLLVLRNPLMNGVLFNSSYWSLAVETTFYLALPLLFYLARGLKLTASIALMVAILMVIPTWARFVLWPGNDAPKTTIDAAMTGFPCQLDCFAWGVLMAGIFVRAVDIRDRLRGWARIGYLGVFLMVACLGLHGHLVQTLEIDMHERPWSFELFHVWPSLATFAMLFFIFDPGCLGARWLGVAWLRFIGIVSYEWFLIHLPVVWLFRDVMGSTQGSVLMYLLKTVFPLALTFGVAVMMYRWFSLPLLQWIRGDERPVATS